MRTLILGLLVASPASAWEFTPGPVCVLTHQMPGASVRLTYDPAKPEYSITLTRPGQPWDDGPDFSIRFDGPRPFTIGTDRHFHPEGDPDALSVVDSGFGNVLDGLQFGESATATIGADTLRIPLDGASGPVADFRLCAPVTGV